MTNDTEFTTDLEEAHTTGIAPWDQIEEELSDFHVTVFRDKFPVTNGHLLFVPNYNTVDVIRDCFDSALRHGQLLVDTGKCDGFNIGLNIGKASGQTVMYPHVHLIPRRTGDCADPTGGVRGVIASQQNYKANGYQLPT